MLWAAERYTQDGNHGAYEHLVHRHGEPDHPLSRYARAYVSGNGEALRQCLPEAVAKLRLQGEDSMAAFVEMMSAGSLLGIARFEQVDVSVSALADRYRNQGPPTLLHWTLQALGYSAAFQGRQDQAERFFDESTRVTIPDRTLSANKPIEARAAFRRGQQSRAFQILLAYIAELFETDNMIATCVVCIEFIRMMAAMDRLAEAAHMLGYLEASNEFGTLASKTLVADAAMKVAGRTPEDPRQAAGHHLDDREALVYMRGILEELEKA